LDGRTPHGLGTHFGRRKPSLTHGSVFRPRLAATLARSDLSIPEAIAKAMSLYLMMAIGFKGGASVAQHGLDAKLLLAILAGVALSAAIHSSRSVC
jgi:hypothetical protein